MSFDVLEDRRMLSATYPAMAHLGDLPSGSSDYGSGATALNAGDIGLSAANAFVGVQLTTPSPSPWVSGGWDVELMATIAVPYLSWTPTGSVTFMDDSATLGTSGLGYFNGTLSGGYGAVLYESNLTVGFHSFTAVYSGDDYYAPSTSNTVTGTVFAPSAVTLAVSPSPSVFGQQVTFTASVTSTAPGPAAPTGTVTFTDGGATLGTSGLSAVNGVMTATLSTSSLALGNHSIKASYSGDGYYVASGVYQSEQVALGANATVLAAPNPSVFGEQVTFTATVAAVVPGSATPTGTLTFMDSGATLGTCTLVAVNGVATATLTMSSLLAGSHSITAAYSGDSNYCPNVSDPATLAIASTFGPMIDLGTLGGDSSCANAVNASGEVVGESAYNVSGDMHAFLYRNGKMTDLGTLPGGSAGSDAYAINDSGEVVGTSSFDSSGHSHAFLYKNGKMTDLGTLPGYTDSVATGINDSGQIVGSCSSYTLPAGTAEHAFLYSNGTMIDLGPLPGGTLSWAQGINDSGQVVGVSAYFPSGNYHAFLYSNGTMTDLGAVPLWYDSSYAYAINASDQVAGYTDDAGEGDPFYFASAFLYSDGKATNLGARRRRHLRPWHQRQRAGGGLVHYRLY